MSELGNFEAEHYIDGEFVKGQDRFEILYPGTNEVVGTAPEGKQEEIDRAVGAAKCAFKSWGRMGANARRPLLHAFANKIREHGEELGHLEILDAGRTKQGTGEHYIDRVANNIEFFADFAVTHGSEAYPMDSGYLNYALHKPVGVAALITPWNVPLMLETWKIGPALAFGNTVVLKPAEFTPLGAWKLAQLAHEAGIPRGVFNVVHGFGPDSAGAYLTQHPDVRLISFTGESATGKEISRVAASTLKKLSLELGGKGANIVFADADIERAVDISLRASFFNQGQFCLATPRLFVERPLYDEFMDKFVAATRARIRPGDPMDPKTTLGPLIHPEHLEKVMGYMQFAKDSGAEFLTGGDEPDLPAPLNRGNFMNPVVIGNVDASHRLCQEEIFGPAITVMPFDDEEQVVELANDVLYGLSAAVQTRDTGRAIRMGDAIEAGTVWINDFFVRDLRVPFGGTKQSGMGREGGHYSMEFYTETKNVCIANS